MFMRTLRVARIRTGRTRIKIWEFLWKAGREYCSYNVHEY